ncbi:hypothetical protein [Mesorhizobium marinum]|uniref:hypothetical protein n=1 Tax=Mesorhizobium marinum TaxID=3228790 RepID=UPI003466B804
MKMTLKSAAREIATAQDKLSRARQLVELMFMAGESLPTKQGSAMTNACDLVDGIFDDVRADLDKLRARISKAEDQQ